MFDVKINFLDLGLNEQILLALDDLGYDKPSYIQKECIPFLLKGRDVLGLAQTGSGKTAAFILPILQSIDFTLKNPQTLILTPTRELAIQIAKATLDFAKYMKKIKILALYGGQEYEIQLRALNNKPQIIIGTPGRLLDHIKRGTLNLSSIRSLILDEADEMLRMGFIDNVEQIVSYTPKSRQTALFSATMPPLIKSVTKRFMNKPQEIHVQPLFGTLNKLIQQNYCVIRDNKIDGLIRFLEIENFNAAIVFVRTKSLTSEISEILERNDYSCAALNGDMSQSLREQTLERFKNGKIDILIATDVASRGLDIDRIELVVNYDFPIDTECYLHRIGRTGRAGRSGKALLFVRKYEFHLLRNIEYNLKVKLSEVKLPDNKILTNKRKEKFMEKVRSSLREDNLEYSYLFKEMFPQNEFDTKSLTVVLFKMAQTTRPLILSELQDKKELIGKKYEIREKRNNNLYRMDVGKNDGVKVKHIVDIITNKARINSRLIGNIKLFSSYSTVELSKSIPSNILKNITHTSIFSKPINLKKLQVYKKEPVSKSKINK